MRQASLFIKRFFDIFGSLTGIIIILPLLTIVSLLIKLTSKGPVLFRQERLGKAGKIFEILKFRTMVVGAEHMGDGLKVRNDKDNRITGIGKFLRSTSLDELPQLFNVVMGQMSLVGPRPPVTYHPYDGYENYPGWAKERFSMRPGMTGLTQVTVRNSVPWEARIPVDIEYIKRFSLYLDTKILLKTIFKMFKKESIYIQPDRAKALSSKTDVNA